MAGNTPAAFFIRIKMKDIKEIRPYEFEAANVGNIVMRGGGTIGMEDWGFGNDIYYICYKYRRSPPIPPGN